MVVIRKICSKRCKKNKTYETTNTLLPLYEYLELTRKYIGRFALSDYARHLLCDEDAISFIAEILISAHCKYDPARNVKLNTYLTKSAIRGIQTWISLKKKERKYVSLHENIAKKSFSNEPKDDFSHLAHVLTPTQRTFLELKYVNGLKDKQISAMYNMTIQGVSYHIINGRARLKQYYESQNICNCNH